MWESSSPAVAGLGGEEAGDGGEYPPPADARLHDGYYPIRGGIVWEGRGGGGDGNGDPLPDNHRPRKGSPTGSRGARVRDYDFSDERRGFRQEVPEAGEYNGGSSSASVVGREGFQGSGSGVLGEGVSHEEGGGTASVRRHAVHGFPGDDVRGGGVRAHNGQEEEAGADVDGGVLRSGLCCSSPQVRHAFETRQEPPRQGKKEATDQRTRHTNYQVSLSAAHPHPHVFGMIY